MKKLKLTKENNIEFLIMEGLPLHALEQVKAIKKLHEKG